MNDLKFTVTHAVEPVEKGITKFNQKLHKISENIKKDRRTKDDSCVATSSSPQQRIIRGIDDPLLNGSVSDTGGFKKKKHRRKSGYTSESGGESSGDQILGGFEIRGRRWVTKD